MSEKNKKLQNAVHCIVFLLLAAGVFVFFTYLFRETKINQRRTVQGFLLEEKNTDDVIFLGASSVYRFWDPLYAWKEAGITSFDYASASMTAVCYIPAIKEIEKRQTPKLLVIDARRFLSRKTGDEEIYDKVRYYTDSLDLGISRAGMIRRFCRIYDRSLSQELEYQLDLIYYHDHYDALLNPINWEMADNRVDRDTEGLCIKGYSMSPKWSVIAEPSFDENMEAGELSPLSEQLFREITEYCKTKSYPFMFLVTPYSCRESDMKEYLRMAEIAQEYGIPFVNMNLYIDETGLDFSRDFYNEDHANHIGAGKVTGWLLSYLCTEYDLPDHRGDEKYASWEEDYNTYLIEAQEATESIKSQITE
ncbi:MAG: hypothetical protein K5686_07455 [Lachnospiraceae bacterium]|nr:hypothetical protein [Lachnospiraceae bacterium]